MIHNNRKLHRVGGYAVDLEKLCRLQAFTPSQVVSSELVYPKGAVPNPRILWMRVELTSGERKFITLPLLEFYEYVVLPDSSIGGWTDGDRGSDYTGLDPRYEVDNSGGEDEVQRIVLDGAEGTEETVET